MQMLELRESELAQDSAQTSPVDIAHLLELIALGDAVSPDASGQMLALLSAQQHTDLMSGLLPLGVRVARPVNCLGCGTTP